LSCEDFCPPCAAGRLPPRAGRLQLCAGRLPIPAGQPQTAAGHISFAQDDEKVAQGSLSMAQDGHFISPELKIRQLLWLNYGMNALCLSNDISVDSSEKLGKYQ